MDDYMELEEIFALFISHGGVITIWPCAKEDASIAYAMKLNGIETRGVTDNLTTTLLEELSLDDQDIGGDYDWAKPDSML